MPYEAVATADTPALIIYLLDMSGSMGDKLNGVTKIEHVNDALFRVITTLVRRSSKGDIISPRYRLAMLGYSSSVVDMLGGVMTIDVVATKGRPTLRAKGETDTHSAFARARAILEVELAQQPKGCPAPMVCHLTDGKYNTSDPAPIVQEIMAMGNSDGPVLVENIFVGENLTKQPIVDPEQWAGLMHVSELADDYAIKLFGMSSPLPQSYVAVLSDTGYNSLRAGARMLIPATSVDLIELAFVMSGATKAAAVVPATSATLPAAPRPGVAGRSQHGM